MQLRWNLLPTFLSNEPGTVLTRQAQVGPEQTETLIIPPPPPAGITLHKRKPCHVALLNFKIYSTEL
jgi:hypothetical protein